MDLSANQHFSHSFNLNQMQVLAAQLLPDWRCLRFTQLGPDSWRLTGLDQGQARCLTLIARGDGSWRALESGQVQAIYTGRQDEHFQVRVSHQAGAAPMDGVLRQICVKVGDRVSPGQVLYVLEAMKMQLQVSARASGEIAALHIELGSRVHKGDILLSFEEEILL